MELTLDQALQKGIAAHKAGQVQEADRLYTAILQAQPKHADANHNMGVLAVGVGKVEAALPFFKTALEAKPSTSQFWLSYIDALIKLDRIDDAKTVFDQAKEKGVKGDSFDKLEQRLSLRQGVPTKVVAESHEVEQDQPNILDTLKLDQAIKLAKKKSKEGSSEEAKRIYQDTLAKFPKNKKAIDGIKVQAGRAIGKTFKVQDPPQDQLKPLINLYSQGQLQQALEQASVLLKQSPSSSILHNICGAVYQELGQFNASIEAYKKSLAIKPDYADAYYNMGIALQDQGNPEGATEAYNKALVIKPDYAEAYSNMGNALKDQGKLEEAIEAYKKALSINPDYAGAYNNMGVALKEQDKLEEAIEAYKKALSFKPDFADAFNNMGITLKDQGQLEEAIEAYKKALSFKPDFADAFNNMGVALKEQDKLEEAIETFNKALSLKPDYAGAYNNMGVALKEQNELEEAIEAFNKALSLKPDYIEAYNNMGAALKAQGKLEKAIEAYIKALSLKPDYAGAYNNMGVALKEEGKLEEAIEALNKALSLKPDYAEAYNNMGITLQEQGKLEEAIEAYNKALAFKAGYAEAYSNMGNTLQEQGKLEEAIEAFNKAISLKLDHADAWINIVFPLQAIKAQISSKEELVSYYPEDTNYQYSQIAKSILHYTLHRGEESVEGSLDEALSLLFSAENTTIKNPTFNKNASHSSAVLPNKIIALAQFARSGTGLLHSLIDGHPEVSTLPSIYFSEYFDHSTWEKIISGGWSEMVNRFMTTYEVLFDASSTVPIEGMNKKLLHNIGQKEGMANVGDQRDEVLSVDKTLFRSELNRLMDCYDKLDAFIFFKLVHAAYDKAINDLNQKTLVFYHIHNPDTYAQLNFVRSAPNANWIMMVREPIQNCESWIKKIFKKMSISKCATKIFNNAI